MATATSTKLSPLGDRVVIKPTPREEMTKSDIVLPDTAKEKPQEGVIIAVGPGRILDDGKREQIDVKKGQKQQASRDFSPASANPVCQQIAHGDKDKQVLHGGSGLQGEAG